MPKRWSSKKEKESSWSKTASLACAIGSSRGKKPSLLGRFVQKGKRDCDRNHMKERLETQRKKKIAVVSQNALRLRLHE